MEEEQDGTPGPKLCLRGRIKFDWTLVLIVLFKCFEVKGGSKVVPSCSSSCIFFFFAYFSPVFLSLIFNHSFPKTKPHQIQSLPCETFPKARALLSLHMSMKVWMFGWRL